MFIRKNIRRRELHMYRKNGYLTSVSTPMYNFKLVCCYPRSDITAVAKLNLEVEIVCLSTRVARSVMCVAVCWAHRRALQILMN